MSDDSWQEVINAALEGDHERAAKLFTQHLVAGDVADDTWEALDRTLVAAFLDLQNGHAEAARARVADVLASAATIEAKPPRSILTFRLDLVETMDHAGVIACCVGDFELAEQCFARGGSEIDRLFRAAPVAELVRNAYHRGLAHKLAGRAGEAAPHAELAFQISERVFARYGAHPEQIGIRRLHDAKRPEDCLELPFFFFLGGVPVRCYAPTGR
jgi:hypothetical protein